MLNGETQEPISAAVIEIIDIPVEPDTTDETGNYCLENVLAGTYIFKVTASDFPTILQEETVSEENHIINFELFPPLYFNNFEQNDGGFISNNPLGWQWGEPTAGEFGAYSGEKVWGTVLAGDYSDNANLALDSPEMNIQANSFLSFFHYHDFEQGNSMYDGGNVKISTDGGNNFSLLYPVAGYDGEISALNEEGFGGTIEDWQEVSFDISEYSGADVIFRWHFASDGSVHDFFGWYIDNVNIYHLNSIDDENYSNENITLLQNYPNPFNPVNSSTNISFSITQDLINPELNIYNIKGQLVRSILFDNQSGKNISVYWNGKNNIGKKVTSGIYFYQISTDDYHSKTKK